MPLSENVKAPGFQLPDEEGNLRSLSEFLGKPVVLYFYPKDDTKGCTTEACNFRDDYSAYENSGVVILGVSPDPSKSHTKFINKYDLPFSLLADEDHAICELYEVWGTKKMYGREYQGVFRTTYLIDKEGIIKKVFQNVRPANHSIEVLEAIRELEL
ncbi:MAG: thioredoxin-dependent thiol peroxidase [Bacteroidales bacterium]|nr:thioredoxin-dependent thiol peroxidase [Bacteroidales bacterium]